MRKTDRIFLCILKHFILADLLTVKVLWAGDSGGRGWGEVGMGVGRAGWGVPRCGSAGGGTRGAGSPGPPRGAGLRVPMLRPRVERLPPALPPPARD